MVSLRICNRDPLVNELRDMFSANIVRVPETRVQPLCAVASRRGKSRYWGSLDYLLVGQPLEIPAGARAESPMSPLNGKRSSSIDAELGVRILDGFLSGFGVPSIKVAPAFANASEVSFAFQGVVRNFIDSAWLARVLPTRAIDVSAGKMFIDKPQWSLLIIDSVIVSPSFSLQVEKSKSGSLELAAPVPHVLGKASASVKVDKSSERELTFSGGTPLTFAFTLVQLHVEKSGAISAVAPDAKAKVLAAAPESSLLHAGLSHVQLQNSPFLEDFDEDVDDDLDQTGS